MSEQEWRPKVGEYVKVVGVSWAKEARITLPGEFPEGSGWYWVLDGEQCGPIHLRNLDPVLEDERRGAPRLWKAGDLAHRHHTYTVTVVDLKADGTPCNYSGPHDGGYRYEFIERRKQDLGREARKS